MVSLSIPSLFDLCGIRFIYLMWTRQDVIKRCSKDDLFDELIGAVSEDLQKFPLPERVKSRLWKYLNPVGKHLLSLLNLWISKSQPESSQKWLTEEMFFEYLVLNSDGLINRRKTAKKLLANRMLTDVFAFRLAYINFLETEVLKLWPHVKLYFLNKILLESENRSNGSLALRAKFKLTDLSSQHLYIPLNEVKKSIRSSFSAFSTEPSEVLVWICYCLWMEKAIDMTELLCFMEVTGGWHEVSRKESDLFCNVACYEYFCNENVKYNHVEMIGELFKLKNEDHHLLCFIFHFSRLNLHQKGKLFELFPQNLISQFLQWPLSLTFSENVVEVWNLIPEEHKHWVFIKIIVGLFHGYWEIFLDRPLLLCQLFGSHERPDMFPGIYCVEHLKHIWIALWEICSESIKILVLRECVFPSIFVWGGGAAFIEIFETSGLKEKLLRIFFENGEAIFELYSKSDMKESLRSLFAKYTPDDFEDLDLSCINLLSIKSFASKTKTTKYDPSYKSSYQPGTKARTIPVNGQFISFMKDYLFAANNMDKTFFINKIADLQAKLL